MASLTKQADLLKEGFYVLEEPSRVSNRYLVGTLDRAETQKAGRFVSYKKDEELYLNAPDYLLSKEGLKELFDHSKGSGESLDLLISFSEDEKASYLENFNRTQSQIDQSGLEKAVLYAKAVNESIEFPKFADFVRLLLRGLEQDKTGYLFALYKPSIKRALIGLSPEFLFKTDDSGHMITTAVAGTAKLSEIEQLENPKIKNEHQAVMRGISSRLSGQVSWGDIHVSQYGDLAHLCSIGFLNSQLYPGTISQLLHPTPAIGTHPYDFYEKVSLGPEGRGFFGGYAELTSNERPFSLVTIRAFEWSKDSLQVCIGGGVVKQSIFEEEWSELENKLINFKKIWGIG